MNISVICHTLCFLAKKIAKFVLEKIFICLLERRDEGYKKRFSFH